MKRLYSLLFTLVVLGFTASSAFATLTVRINNKTQTQINMAGPQPVCSGSDVYFFYDVINNPPMLPYTISSPAWSGTAAAFLSDANATFVTFNCPTPGTYQLTFSAVKDGTTYSVTQPIVVHSPDNLYLDFPTPLPYDACEGVSINFEASGTLNYYWERQNDGAGIGYTASVDETPPSTGSWTYRVYGSNEGCFSIPEYIEFDVIVHTAATADAGGPYEVCAESTVQLNGSIGGSASSAEWVGGLGTFSPNRQALNAFYTPHATEDGTTVPLLLRTNDPPGVCSFGESSALVMVHSLPSGSITLQKNVSCYGGNDGEVTVDGSGYGSPFTYSLDGGVAQPSGTFTGLSAGSYIVTIFNSNGCSFDVNVTITQPATALSGSIDSQTNVNCHGGNDGEVTVVGAGGTLPYQYSINGVDFQSSGTFSNLSAGNYNISIKDNNGCSTIVPVSITQPATAVSGSISLQTDVLCFGQSTGSVTIAGAGGTAPYTYSLNGGTYQASGTFTNLAAGSYTVTVRDANGCTANVAVTITQPAAALTGTITNQVNVLCFGDTSGEVTVAGDKGTSPYQYSLDGGTYQASGTFTGLTAGNFVVTIRDANGCTFDVPVTITQPAAALTGAITNQVNVNCFGGSDGEVTVAGADGTSPYQYSLNGGAYQPSGYFTGLSAGAHTVTVMDANGCTYAVMVSITQPAMALTGSVVNQTNVNCFGGSDGEVTVAGANGTAPYQYSLDGGTYQASGTFTGLNAGNHTVTVMDANGCTHDVAFTITQPTALTGTVDAQTDVLCYGNSTGAVTVSGHNATPPYQYSLNGGSYQASGTFTGLAAGTHTITIRDANGCTTDVAVTITQPAAALTGSVTNQINVNCFGGNDGEVTVAGADGTAPYQYSLDGGTYQASGTFTGLTAGNFVVTIRDANGCTFDVPVTITQPAAALTGAITNQVNVNCFGGSDGEVTVAGADGTSPYQYSLNGGAYQPSGYFTGLSAGAHTVTVMDANGCTYAVMVSITQPAMALTGSVVNQTNVNCFGGSDGEVTVAGANGTAPYQYSLDGGTYQASGTFTGLNAGNHTVTVMDANGCTHDVAFTITQPTALTGTVDAQTDVLCYGNSTGAVTVSGHNATPPYQYSLNGGSYQASGTFTGLAAGTHTITIRDANGCTTDVAVTITQPAAALTGSVTNQVDVDCYGDFSGEVTVAGSGGTAPYEYSFEGGTYQVSGTFSGLTAGSYIVTVMDAHGCTYDVNVEILQPANPLTGVVVQQHNVNCFGGSDGWVEVVGSGGTAPYEYSINGVDFTSSGLFNNLSDGSYTITIRDAKLCVATITVTITQPATPLSGTVLNQINLSCYDSTDGEVTIGGVGGTAPYEYSLDGGAYQTSGTFSNLVVGSYTITIMDANGCTFDVMVTISAPNPITIDSYTVTSIIDQGGCFGDNSGEIEVLATGGTPNYVYSLYNGATLVGTQNPVHPAPAVFTNLVASNSYRIVVTDSNSCTPAVEDNIALVQPDQLMIVDVNVTNAICYGENNGTITITAQGGSGDYIYSIYGPVGPFSPGNVINVTAGYYEVWVMDDNGCKAEYPGNPVFIDEPTKIVFSYEVNHIESCYGAEEGSIIIKNVTGGSGSYEYSIMEPAVWQLDPVFNNLPGGPTNQYYLRVKDSQGCIVTGNSGLPVTIDEPTEITFNTSSTDVTGCWYNTNGTITISNVTGGTGTKWVSVDATGTWQKVPNSFSVITFANLGVGEHTVRVRDRDNGPDACEVTRLIIIDGPPPIVISAIDMIHNECYGQTDGQVTINASGGTGTLYYTLLFNGNPFAGPQTSNSFYNLPAGQYTVEVTDDNGCLLTENFEITSPDELLLNIEVVDILCSHSGPEGIIRAMGTGGNETYTITLYQAGVELTNHTNVSGNVWVEFTNLAGANDYEVIIRDAKHPLCAQVSSGAITVVVPDELEFNIASLVIKDLDCFGDPTGSITIAGQGGTLPYTYILYDEDGNQVGDAIVATDHNPVEFINLPAGNYAVSIDDSHGCGPVDYSPITVGQPNVIEIDPSSISITHISCFGETDGEISITANGGTGNLYYTITQNGTPVSGFTTQVNNGTFAPLAAGTYVIEVTDDNGCGPIYSDELTVIEPNAIEINVDITNAQCHGDNGSIMAMAEEGTAPYTYTLKNAADVTVGIESGDVDEWVTFDNIAVGDYTLYVQDVNGCEVSSAVSIIQPDEITINILIAESPECYPDGTASTGLIEVEALGGSGVYTYSLYRNGIFMVDNNTGVFVNLSAGVYYVEVIDANGCGPVVSPTITLDSPTTLEIDNVIVTDVNCYGANTGELEIIVSGNVGTPLYTLSSDNDHWQSDNIFTGLAAGHYIIRVKDDNHCAVSFEVDINQAPQIIITTIETPPTTSVDTDGSIAINVTGGTPNYWYELHKWDVDAGVWVMIENVPNTALTNYTFNGLGVGAYRIVVRDSFGCETFVEVSLSQFTVFLTGTDALCHSACDGTIAISALGGTIESTVWTFNGAAYDMESHWDNDTQTYIDLCAGLYQVVATNTDGVESTASVIINQPDAIAVSFVVTVPNCYTAIPEGKVEFTITGGTPFAYGYDITWDTGSAQGYVADNLAGGNYTFTITDANGCEYILVNVVVDSPEAMTMESMFTYDLSCHGDFSGGISMLVEGGSSPITYHLEGPDGYSQTNTDGIFTGLAAGDYTITIVDSNGCDFYFDGGTTETVTLTEPDAIVITVITPLVDLECHNDTLDMVEMQVIGGTGELTYSWDNGQDGLNLIDVSVGTYTLTVTDENGCVSTQTVVVPGPDPFDISSTITIAKCKIAPEGNDGKIEIHNITGGNGNFIPDFNVQWFSTVGHLENQDGLWYADELQAGDYYALITDKKGCLERVDFYVPFSPDNIFEVGIIKDPNYCWGAVAELEAYPVIGTFGTDPTFEWTNMTKNPNLIIGRERTFITDPLDGDQVMRVRVVSGMGCLETRRDTLDVYPQIGPYLERHSTEYNLFFSDADLAAFRIDNKIENEPDSTVITLLADQEYGIEIRTKAADYTLTYRWTPKEFFNPDNGKITTLMFPTGQYENYQTGTLVNFSKGEKQEQYIPVTAYVKSEYGCEETIDLKARILNKINVANVFSPNGDGINDTWTVPYAHIFPNLEIVVLNRWGAEVWKAKATDAARGWNGTNMNGKDLPIGTYYYVINLNVPGNKKWKPITGSVTIVR